ncbi:hypothetical protein PS687_02492 [Pseudomonas fluorescens]|nr:hypothetical protein PS687_02492 [Pseudomonas fluorescens]
MSKVIRFHRTGSPEVLQINDVEARNPGTGEDRIKGKALGLNRAEAMYRLGQYTFSPEMRAILGYEAAVRSRPSGKVSLIKPSTMK